MQVRLLESEIRDLVEIDAGDHTWWVESRIEEKFEALLEMINEKLFEKDQIIIVPEEKYLNCTCKFEKKHIEVHSGSRYSPLYKEVYQQTSFCHEHEDENPDLYDANGHPKDCKECRAEFEQ
jgi:hypothetical protein